MLDDYRKTTLYLDNQKDYIPDNIVIKQGDDKGRELEVFLTNNGKPADIAGITAKLTYERPDAVKDSVDMQNTGKSFLVKIPSKANQVVGKVTFAIQFYSSDTIIETKNFVALCEKSALSVNNVLDSTSFKDILKLGDNIVNFENQAEQTITDYKAKLENQEKASQEAFDQAQKSRAETFNSSEADRERRFVESQSSRAGDYSSWKTTIASDAESRIQAKEQLFTNSINAANSAKSKFDSDASQALSRVDSSIQAKERAYDEALKADKAKYASSLSAQEQAYTKSLSEHESSWESQQASAKSASDGRINKLDNIIAAYEGETPLTPSIADTKYQAKGDYATKSELSGYIKDSEGSVTSTHIQDGTIKGSDIANNTITASNLADTYVTETSANRKYATKSTATTSSDGLISASDKSKLDSIQSGAQKNTVTSVNGRTGAVTIEEPAEATTSKAGLISASDKAKLNGIQAGAQKNTINKIEGKSGDNVTFPVATASQWGWMGASDKAKLDKIEAGAQKNPTDYVNTSMLNSRLSQKQDKGSYVSSSDILKIKVVTSIPASVEANTLYLVKE